MDRLRRLHFHAFWLTVALGILWKKLFVMIPVPVVGLLAPINNSMWESLKICFWPYFIGAFCLTRQIKSPDGSYWRSHFAGLLTVSAAFLSLYCLLNGGFHQYTQAMYWFIYAASVYLGYWASFKLYVRHRMLPRFNNLILAVCLLGLCLILFSFAAPDLPLFIDYGELTIQAV